MVLEHSDFYGKAFHITVIFGSPHQLMATFSSKIVFPT